MAKLSNDKTYVTVESGDTLSEIARDYAGGASKYKQLAAINNISNPNLIYVGQKIYLTSSGSGSGSTSTSTNSNKPSVKHFGLLSTGENTLFATWTWGKSNTASYKVLWLYDTGSGIWFEGSNSTVNVDKDAPELSRQSTYSIPSNAKRVKFKVKPISETYKKNDKETNYWTADWSDEKIFVVGDSLPPTVPSAPTVEIDGYKLTMTLDNVKSDTTSIDFEIVKDNNSKPMETKNVTVTAAHASYSRTVSAGSEYKVRCRAVRGSLKSEWSEYSANVSTTPSTPASITTIKAKSETSVYLEWEAVNSAKTYDIEYTTKKEYFDGSDQTSTKSGIEFTHFEITGLETGTEYFFRVRATNEKGSSGWSEPKSVIIGKKPAAPTTWSSSTTVIVGEELTLYWVHNSIDGSSQTYADLELYIGGVKETHTIKNSTEEDEKDKTSFYVIDTSEYAEGTQIQWRVRTRGITNTYGDWSIQRTIDIHAPATLELSMNDIDGNPIETLTAFPAFIEGLPGPKTQVPIGYHLTIASNEIYETVDQIGNAKIVNKGEAVYSKYFDTSTDLLVELSANNLDLENNISYTVTCVVSMNSGLRAEASLIFSVNWTDETHSPNAEISIDEESLTAYIRPYCEERKLVYRKVVYNRGVYTVTDEEIPFVYGTAVKRTKTTSGEQVYSGTTAEDESVYYCEFEERTPVTDVLLSVYRREFDGSFIELATGLDSAKYTTITDPHPALDYARYRIVATSKTTGAVSYYDLPGYPVGGTAVIIQWDEEWSSFETSEEAAMEQPAWSGSLLKLPYNIDVSDDNSPEVELVEYIGREHPVAYYGTHLGHKSTWNVAIDKADNETLYALRRLQRWMGNVYVREPSGSGYWANIKVSFSQKHNDLTIPVTLNITRVEGGV